MCRTVKTALPLRAHKAHTVHAVQLRHGERQTGCRQRRRKTLRRGFVQKQRQRAVLAGIKGAAAAEPVREGEAFPGRRGQILLQHSVRAFVRNRHGTCGKRADPGIRAFAGAVIELKLRFIGAAGIDRCGAAAEHTRRQQHGKQAELLFTHPGRPPLRNRSLET